MSLRISWDEHRELVKRILSQVRDEEPGIVVHSEALVTIIGHQLHGSRPDPPWIGGALKSVNTVQTVVLLILAATLSCKAEHLNDSGGTVTFERLELHESSQFIDIVATLRNTSRTHSFYVVTWQQYMKYDVASGTIQLVYDDEEIADLPGDPRTLGSPQLPQIERLPPESALDLPTTLDARMWAGRPLTPIDTFRSVEVKVAFLREPFSYRRDETTTVRRLRFRTRARVITSIVARTTTATTGAWEHRK
jgi:hypothetical protein